MRLKTLLVSSTRWLIAPGMFLLCLCGSAYAQPNITAAEYFYDTDPGPGNGTALSITPGTTIDLNNINVPTTSLSLGWHIVCVRTRNASNVWGYYDCRRFYVREAPVVIPAPIVYPITQAEFFYDTDNGPGTGTAIPVTTGATVDLSNINLSNTLTVGWHTVHVRVKNQNNVWSGFESRKIFVRGPATPPSTNTPSPIVAFEYFVDTDPGAGNSTGNFTVPSSSTVDLVDQPLNVGTLSLGTHQVYIRAKNQDGKWGPSAATSVNVVSACPILTAPSATGVSRCDPGSVQLIGTGVSAGETYRWYSSNTSLTPLFTGNPYNTATLNANTTFYVSAFNPTTFCESARTPVTASISGIAKPSLNISGTLEVCEGTTKVLIAPAGYSSYTWSNAQTTQQITVSTTGIYSVVVNNGVCSSPASDALDFTVSPRPSKPSITADNDGSICGLPSITLHAPSGADSYLWSNGATTESITVTTAGSFVVTVGNAAGCESPVSDPFIVTGCSSGALAPAPPVVADVERCGPGEVVLSASGASAGQSYNWYDAATGGSIVATTSTLVATISQSTDYYVTVFDSSVPIESTRLKVSASMLAIPAQPVISVIGRSVICVGSLVALSAPAGFSHYSWSNGATTQTVLVEETGQYTVTTGSSASCLSVVSEPVQVNQGTSAECGVVITPEHHAPKIEAESFSVQIQSMATYPLADLVTDEDGNADVATLLLVDGPGVNGKSSGGTAHVDADGNLILDYTGIQFAGTEFITLQVCDNGGLCSQEQFPVDVVGEVKVYNGITPDGDGYNDFMLIQFIDVIDDARRNKVTILNRWGDGVFEIEDYNNTDRVFEGKTSEGKELPAGSYLYKVALASGKTYTGYITLKR